MSDDRRITDIKIIAVHSPEGSADNLDGTADTVIVKVHDAAGRYGLGGRCWGRMC